MNKKLYISGPMSGITDYNIPEFNRAEIHLRSLGYDVFNPASLGVSEEFTWEDYMKRDIKGMMECDEIVLLSNWQKSRGAKLELMLAQTLKMKVLVYPTLEEFSESICEEADRLVSDDRGNDYGHPYDNFTLAGKLMAPILGLDTVTPEQVALCMIQFKISRELFKSKRDNRTDGAGYFKCLDKIVEKRKEKTIEYNEIQELKHAISTEPFYAQKIGIKNDSIIYAPPISIEPVKGLNNTAFYVDN